jgi:hypothetical protein
MRSQQRISAKSVWWDPVVGMLDQWLCSACMISGWSMTVGPVAVSDCCFFPLCLVYRTQGLLANWGMHRSFYFALVGMDSTVYTGEFFVYATETRGSQSPVRASPAGSNSLSVCFCIPRWNWLIPRVTIWTWTRSVHYLCTSIRKVHPWSIEETERKWRVVLLCEHRCPCMHTLTECFCSIFVRRLRLRLDAKNFAKRHRSSFRCYLTNIIQL